MHGISVRVDVDDPRRPDVAQLIAAHLAFAHASSPRDDVHALDGAGLSDPAITFFSARSDDGALLAIGALKQLDATHGEIKSMHTAAAHRRSGAGRAMLRHLIDAARDRGCARVSLETGSGDVFIPARTLYERAGFQVCEPFDGYRRTPYSVCMTMRLE